MAVVKVFTALGVKTVEMLGNLEETPFDEEDIEEELIDDGELTVGTPLE